MQSGQLQARVDGIRRFNRFFTRRIGVLGEGLLHSPYSLTEARVLFEVAHGEGLTASDLVRDLNLDPGYLSRVLARLGEKGLVDKVPSEEDGRRRILHLTAAGSEAFSLLDRRSREEAEQMLADLSEEDQHRLLAATRIVQDILSAGVASHEPFLLRRPVPGDMGWVVQRHGELYSREYGWDERFEALVARIVADFVDSLDPDRERCWMAEVNGNNVGCVFVVRESDEVAKLRLLLVEPEARGMALGARLVEECVRFARDRNYQKLVLWTNSVLHPARRIYEEQGFKLVEEEQHHSFGADLVGQNWELKL